MLQKIKICESPYNGPDLKDQFSKFPFPLDDFQKYAINAIYSHENILVMAATGSGKTLCAEYAIHRALELGKKIIYTSPIKSLSNQKFNEFNQKFPKDSVGILTGDIKYNPEAPILIMTTEILRNLLYYNEIKLDPVTGTSLRINLKDDVSSVVFDEVHYINDPERGKVWEESLILLPKNIGLVLLSATITGAEDFGQWLQDIKGIPLHLIGNSHRVIPLKHYYYISLKSLNNKGVKLNDNERNILEKYGHQLIPILENEHDLKKDNIETVHKIYKEYNKLLHKEGALNTLLSYLELNKMLPAILFTFSRKKCEKYASLINLVFNSSDEQASVERLLEFHLHKLERPESYRNLPEFIHLKQLLIKGIAYHHSGLIPVLKEMIEILFSRGLVKVLFATETFAVGINMPTKTVVFTALDKYDSSGNNRWLHTHEYLQMAGRAGRRGMDTIGYVIHLANLCDLPNMTELKTMMTGKSQTIKSRFTLNYQFILKAILNESVDLQQIVKTSFWNQELTQQINSLKAIKSENMEPIDLDEYKDCQRYETLMKTSIDLDGIIKLHPIIIKENKKAAQKMLTPGFKLKFNNYTKIKSKIETATELNNRIDSLERRLEDDLQKVLVFLQDYDYISKNWNKYQCFEITKNDILMKGIMASQVNQCQELLLTEIVHRNLLHELSSAELAAYLSIFSNYSLPDNTDYNQNNPNDLNNFNNLNNLNNMNERKITYSWYLMTAYRETKSIADNLYDEEVKRNIYLPSDWDISKDLMEITFKWASEGVMLKDFPLGGIFAGEFIKEMIKVGHLADEVAILADLLQMTELKQKALEVSRLVIKDVINVDSLYLKNIH